MLSSVSKKKAGILLAAMLLFILSVFAGCTGKGVPAGSEQEPAVPEDKPGNGNAIKSPIEVHYTVQNPLEIVETNSISNPESTEDRSFSYQYIQIKGLKDQAIEKKINDELITLYNDLKNQERPLPPYRGIKVKIPQGSKIVQDNVYMSVAGSFNNILSIMINKTTTYALPDEQGQVPDKSLGYYENSQYVSEVKTLNYDLNTGEQFTLKEVFCDDTDYKEAINDYMQEYLSSNYAEDEGYYYMGGDIKLVESFKGFVQDPQFVLYPYGLSLVLDHTTPQFDTRFMAFTPLIYFSSFNNTIAISERFYNEEENLFDSNEPLVKSLMANYMMQDVGGNDYYKIGNVNVYTNWRYSSALPEKIQKLLNGYMKIDEKAIAKMNEALSGLSPEKIEQIGGAFYDSSVYADSIGRYININSTVYSSYQGKYNEVLNYRCFDRDSLKELELGDLFLNDYDPKPVILNAIRKVLQEISDNSGNPIYTKAVNNEEVEKIYQTINGFSLSPDAVSIPVNIHNVDSHYQNTLNLYIPYKDFGCEHMTIFD